MQCQLAKWREEEEKEREEKETIFDMQSEMNA
jgi:hypothetical protein